MKCIKMGCHFMALENSNYCARHKPINGGLIMRRAKKKIASGYSAGGGMGTAAKKAKSHAKRK